jgi:hypothetical protein
MILIKDVTPKVEDTPIKVVQFENIERNILIKEDSNRKITLLPSSLNEVHNSRIESKDKNMVTYLSLDLFFI